MNDRPDWLPEPPPENTTPMGKRFGLAVASVASLLFGTFGILVLLSSGVATFAAPNPDATELVTGFVLAFVLLSATFVMRRYLHRERQALRNRNAFSTTMTRTH